MSELRELRTYDLRTTLADLRVYDPARLRTDAEQIVYCPRCHCRKSGYAEQPNHVDDCCLSPACECHAEITRTVTLTGDEVEFLLTMIAVGLGATGWTDDPAGAALAMRVHEKLAWGEA